MSVCSHAVIGPRRHVTVDLKKGRLGCFIIQKYLIS
jgi:hypothetical protein